MSQRIEQRFSALKAASRKAVIPYVSAGDPMPEKTVSIMQALVAGGADLLELGIPFSDPAADGETIQKANERALAKGVTLKDVLRIVREFRTQDNQTPLILMGYLNSFERHGAADTLMALSKAGADGVILVDCPAEALPDYQAALDAADIAAIQLIAPTTSDVREKKIIQAAEGFIYYVSLRGVTGKQKANADAIREAMAHLESICSLPVCIGFGIRDGKTARAMAEIADGVVIGSALVAKLHEAAEAGANVVQTAKDFMINIRSAIDA